MEELNFPRRFQLWEYTVSHRQLLVRRTKSEKHSTRVDVLFKNVIRINLPTIIDGLRVREADEQTTAAILESLWTEEGAYTTEDKHVFRVDGRNVSGFVVAGFVGAAEDEGEYHDPSALLSR